MPLEAIAINDLNTPLIKKPKHDDELKQRVQALYAQNHDTNAGKQAIARIQQTFATGGCLYVGMFNDKPICSVSCMPDSNKNMSQLSDLAVHSQNENRGIEVAFLAKISRLEANLMSDDAKIQNFLQQLPTNL